MGTTYQFFCHTTDNAGNTRTVSASTAVRDLAGAAYLYDLPTFASNSSPLWNDAARTILLRWDSTDPMVKCYNVQYKTDTIGYANLTSGGNWCLSQTSFAFGPLEEGTRYQFRVRALDTADILRNFSDGSPLFQQINTTADSRAPMVNLTVYDGQMHVRTLTFPTTLTVGWDTVTIAANATDATSGVDSQFLTTRTGTTVTITPCNRAGTDSSCPLLTLPVDDDITFRVNATDRAGNVNASRTVLFTSHPLVSFATRQTFLALGESAELELTVRNLQNARATISLALCQQTGSQPQDCPDVTVPSFTEPDDINSLLKTVTLNANDETVVRVRIASASPGTANLPVFASSDQGVSDTDALVVQVGYPPEFPDAAPWSFLLIGIVSSVMYADFSRKTKIA